MPVTTAAEMSTFQEHPGYSSYTIARVIVHRRMAALGQPWYCFGKQLPGLARTAAFVLINHFPQSRASQPRFRRTPLCIPREIVGSVGTNLKKNTTTNSKCLSKYWCRFCPAWTCFHRL